MVYHGSPMESYHKNGQITRVQVSGYLVPERKLDIDVRMQCKAVKCGQGAC